LNAPGPSILGEVIPSGLAGVRLVMTRCALALPHEREGGRYLYILQKPDGGA
jgi:hypothetical protein